MLNLDGLNLSCLGFGTSGLMGSAFSDKGRMALLEHVYSEGITHFDTAPLYGQGDAETVIGKFAVNKRDKITLATKFGLFAREQSSFLKFVKPVARYANRKLIDHRKKQSPKSQSINAGLDSLHPEFLSAPQIQADPGQDVPKLFKKCFQSQLELSLHKLKTEFVDLLFLHDVCLNQLSDELVDALIESVASGKVTRLGLATSRSRALAISQAYPEIDFVIQVSAPPFEWKEESLRIGKGNTIYHSCFRQKPHWMEHWLNENKALLRSSFTLQSDHELTEEYVFSALRLQRALQLSKGGTVLFSSASKQHISANSRMVREHGIATKNVLEQLESQMPL